MVPAFLAANRRTMNSFLTVVETQNKKCLNGTSVVDIAKLLEDFLGQIIQLLKPEVEKRRLSQDVVKKLLERAKQAVQAIMHQSSV